MRGYDPDFPIDDEAGLLDPVDILRSWPDVPVTINHPLSIYPQLCVSRDEARGIADAITDGKASEHVRLVGGSVVLRAGGRRQVYSTDGALVLAEQIRAALDDYELKEVA